VINRLQAWKFPAGDGGEARGFLERADQAAERHGSRRERALNDLGRAELYRREGEPDGARALVERALATFRELGMTLAAESTARLLKA
jgi:hypothetical protein